MMQINSPELWQNKFPKPSEKGNKYDRGHAVILGANIFTGSTGATKLAAYSALRSGAGLVSIVCNKESASVYASSMMSIMIKTDYGFLKDAKIRSYLIGPGNGVTEETKENVINILKLSKNTVLDADALTVFENNPTEMFKFINSDVVLTPHHGEFKRIFPTIDSAAEAAKLSGATVLLKGRDTIIASPSGKCVINKAASPYLATAGSGDVLAGIITGLMAQGVSGFDSCCIASYIHAKAAENFGPGLISEDLLSEIPKILSQIVNNNINE